MRTKEWDTERARRLPEEGHTNAEVAEMVGISVVTLARWKSKEGLTTKKKMPPRVKGDKVQEEHYTTAEVVKMATEARSRGLSYGQLVAERENRVAVSVPQALSAAKAVTPAQAQEMEREVFTPTDDDAVELHFVLNDEEVYLRAATGARAAKLLKWIDTVLTREA